jgi:2-amino-4-hydroxy-6-hydroxymethyldihydropteridine diphosphokinase
MTRIFIALGSNIDPEANLRRSTALLRERWPAVRFSSVYRSKARERTDQHDFLNAVAAFDSDQSPEEIFTELQVIEQRLGKDPPYRFGPRTIDLDLLLDDDLILRNEVTIPHPRMHQRRFVLEPLCELIVPAAEHPVLHETWEALLARTMDQDCERTDLVL